MMGPIIRNIFTLTTAFFLTVQCLSAKQSSVSRQYAVQAIKDSTPYRIITSGKQITIKSTKEIKNIMVWTASGHRILEQKNVNSDIFNFRITINEKIFFIMMQLSDGKVYSKKIGIQ